MKYLQLCWLALLLTISSNSFAGAVELFEQQVSGYQGKVIYVDFWASWCGPCRQSFPWMNQMQRKYGEQGFRIISINLDSDPGLAAKFLAQSPAEFSIIADPRGLLAKTFKLKGMPSSLLIDRQGNIVSNHVGFTDDKRQGYEHDIVTLLNQSASSLGY